LSAAAISLVCFFLPWIDAGFALARDSASGYDLARHGHRLLWLVPALMLTVLAFGAARFVLERAAFIFAFAGTAGGSLTAYVIYHEREMLGGMPAIIPAQWTLWYWLGFFSSVAVATAAFAFYVKRARTA
jgi:hypothetical protein